MSGLASTLLRRRSIDDVAAAHTELKRRLTTLHLTALGVGGTVGTGIFFVLAEAAPLAGPGVVLSFMLAAVTAGLTALCYAEMASIAPVSGSSYSYAYLSLGEFAAHLVGWFLILEYGVSSAAVAVGWSEYLNNLIIGVTGHAIPDALLSAPAGGGIVNLPAVILVAMCGTLLIRGVRESAAVNAVMVAIKVAVLIFFVCVAVAGFKADHFHDFFAHGWSGVGAGASIIFFSYIGLDAVSTAGDEAKDPKKSMPRALVYSLVIVTLIYLLVSLSAIGAQRYQLFAGQEAGLSQILANLTGSSWPAIILSAGAVISVFSVTLVCMFGQTRIFFSMGQDGLMPTVFKAVSTRTRTPVKSTVIVSVFVAILAGLLPINVLFEATSIGALSAFTSVALGVIVLRIRRPDITRGFKVPGYPVTPVLAIIACIYLLSGLSAVTWIAFVSWMALAVIVYFAYGRRHSTLNADVRSTPSSRTD